MSEVLNPDFRNDIEKKYGKGIGPGESTIHSSNEYNQGTIQKQLAHEQLNSAMNWKIIIDAIKSGRARDIADEPKVDKTPCFILGSGPSLDDSIKYLKDWKGGIICTTSHALTLMYHGIEPTHILVLDPFCIDKEIEGVDWSKTRTKLIVHPGVHPSLIEKWPNEILLYIQNSGRPDSFYANAQKIMYSHREGEDLRNPIFHFYIRTEMMIFACSPPMQLFAADKLGYGTIFLAGCDFAYHNDKSRFTDYTVSIPERLIECDNAPPVRIEAKWEKHEHPFVKNETMKLTNNGLYSEEVHLYYKKNMISAWRLSLQNVYTTDHGAMPEVPYTDIKKVIRKQGLEYPKQSKQFISKITERYLASVNAYVVEAELGVLFVESNDYKKELPLILNRFKLNYKCTKCGALVQSNDGNDHINDVCPNCKNKTLVYANKVDFDYNMKKFEKLYAMTHEIEKEVIPINEQLIGQKLEESLKK
jgi:DNA-directed RNA polymerase subunit RPC12/RpoP